ncbi:MAG: entericidin A/B family lipoprotein [Methylococcales bacterium]|nr:entericidin A/B family lipoprotein [Methylococcales bacterium]
MKKIFKQLTFILLTSCLLSLSACNAWHGLGKDLQKAGRAIERKASR